MVKLNFYFIQICKFVFINIDTNLRICINIKIKIYDILDESLFVTTCPSGN